MNSFIIVLFFSASVLAQNGLEKQTYTSKKNMFENKYAEVTDAYEEYWKQKKELQAYDTLILHKEESILTTKVKLENVKRELLTERKLKRQLNSEDAITKETIFVKSGNDYITADVNNPEHFLEPEANSEKICLKENGRCFPFKTEKGKRVLVMNKQEIKIELEHLKKAKTTYTNKIYFDEGKRDALITNRTSVESDVTRAERKFDKKKASLNELFESKKAGINESFVDELVVDANKETFFGAGKIDPENSDTKGQLLTTLNNNVFGKDTYGLLDQSNNYQIMDEEYSQTYTNVNNLKTNYDLEAPSLASVSPAVYTFPDASLMKITGEVTLAKVTTPEINNPTPNQQITIANNDNEEPQGGTTAETTGGTTGEATGGTVTGETAGGTTGGVVIDGGTTTGGATTGGETTGGTEGGTTGETAGGTTGGETTGGTEGGTAGGTTGGVVEKEIPKEETPEEICAKEAVAKILELFKDDKQDILGKQFSLTAIKTALYLKGKAAPGSVPVSLEKAVNNDQANLTEESKILELKKIYADHGIEGSAAGMEATVDKMKNQKFNYFSPQTRMTNDEASHLYLLLSKSDSPVKFGMEDAAVAWAYGQMNKFQKGTEAYNNLNMSTHVNKMMSATMAGGSNMSVEKLEAKKKETEKVIDDAIAAALKTTSETCQNLLAENCVLLTSVKEDAFSEMIKTILKTQEAKLDDSGITGFHIKAQKYLGRPGDADFIEMSKGRMMPNTPQFTGDNLKTMQIAAGKTIFTRKPHKFKYLTDSSAKCYETSYESGKVQVSESSCEN